MTDIRSPAVDSALEPLATATQCLAPVSPAKAASN